jgi:hypothetical protein|tara:strand:+ start:181 stop:564 length:384 start_codon:yes stop_codon:yes gene_type:complete
MTDKPDENVENDYEYSKRTYYDLIEKGQNALDDMIDVARNLEHPRAYEVLSGMIKNVSDVNDRLMDLNKKKKDFYKNDTKQIEGNNTTNNNLFVGSTTDLQRMLKNVSDNDNVIDINERKPSDDENS